MILRLNKKWFNPLYYHLRHYVEIPDISQILVYGGKSSAKTYTIAQLFQILGITKNCKSIAYRKEQTTISTTLKPAMEKSIDLLHLNAAYKVYDFKFVGKGRNEIALKGLDTEGKVKGIEGFTYLLFDELDHFSEQEWQQANISLRGIANQKLFGTWNPVRDDIWIKKMLDKETWTTLPNIIDNNPYSKLDDGSSVKMNADGSIILIHTTYLDNKWTVGADGYGYRDDRLIKEYEKLKHHDDNAYKVNVLGKWGRLVTGSEFYHAFSRGKHVRKLEYIPELPIHPTYDFNVLPFMTQLVCQVVTDDNKTSFRFFKEYCLRNPDNSSEAAARYLIKDFGQYKPTIFYYGDASGKNRIAGQGNRRNFDDIESILLPYLNSASDRVLNKNPNVFAARDFINLILSGYYQGIEILIDESCKELIADMENCKVSIDGKDKTLVNDKIIGAKYQKYGHTSDALTYLVVSVLYNLYKARSANS